MGDRVQRVKIRSCRNGIEVMKKNGEHSGLRRHLIRLEEHCGCNSLPIQGKTTELRLNSAGNQLLHLIQDYPTSKGLNSPSSEPTNCHHKRIKTMLSIYWKLLNISPIELHLISKDNHADNYIDILSSRLQVLHYIENLNGYCDSINRLRLILKSTPMIGVMIAYDKIMINLRNKKADNEKQDYKFDCTNLTRRIEWHV